MYYDTIVQDPRALRYLADIVGAHRIMMGSDMPFPIGDLAPTKIVTETKFSDTERAAINGGLAARLFSLCGTRIHETGHRRRRKDSGAGRRALEGARGSHGA